MIAYKGFNKDLTCRGYQFTEEKVHTEPEANCVKNGFHCAENPLDCLSYYPNWENSVYYIVKASGDIHEDASDTKLSCTNLRLIKKLSLIQFVYEALKYMEKHPIRPWNRHVYKNRGEADQGFVIVRGKDPIAKGPKDSILGLVTEEPKGNKVIMITVIHVDGVEVKANTWYSTKDNEHLIERKVKS